MKKNSELRAEARAALKGNWNTSALYAFVGIIVVYLVSGVLSFVPLVGSLLAIALTIPVIYALYLGYLRQLRGEEQQVEWLFSYYKKTVWVKMIVKYLFIFLWAMIAVVPLVVLIACLGVGSDFMSEPYDEVMLMSVVMVVYFVCLIPCMIKTYAYAMAEYLIQDKPELTARETLAMSTQMMKGNKMKLFLLDLSFLGWGILCVFTLFIGYFWLAPYMYTSRAAFYEDLKLCGSEPVSEEGDYQK